MFLPEFIIWPDFDIGTEIFYLAQDGSSVNIHSNIKPRPGFTYYCIFIDDSSDYATDPIFKNDLLTSCPFPFVSNLTF